MFSGLSTNKLFSAPGTGDDLVREDISPILQVLAPIEAPFLDWIGDADVFARQIEHEYIEDFVLPHYVTASVAVNSATGQTDIGINGLGEALTVGTLLELENATPELMQVTSILSANTIRVSRDFDGAGIGSLTAGTQLFVRGYQGVEGQEHNGTNTQRYSRRSKNTVGLFNIPVAVSGTTEAIASEILGMNTFEQNRAKIFAQVPSILEKEVIRGKLNAAASLGSNTQTRTMKGIREYLTTINSQVANSAFAHDPHTILGDVWESMYQNGASETLNWGIVAGRTWFKNISDLNDTKVQDSNERETFKRVIRRYEGPFGNCTVFLSRVLPANELLIVARERIKVPPLQGRSFFYKPMADTGDNSKGAVIGEYTTEVHHPETMARLRGGA